MVELRKRPSRNEPPAPPPAAKKGRGAAGATTTTTPNKSKVIKAPTKAKKQRQSGVTAKAKNAASKVKETVAGPLETDNDNNAAKQSAVQDQGGDEPEPEAVVETGEAGMIPETAGTAPSTTTVPAETSAGALHSDGAGDKGVSVSDTASASAKPATATQSPVQGNVVDDKDEDKPDAMGTTTTAPAPATATAIPAAEPAAPPN